MPILPTGEAASSHIRPIEGEVVFTKLTVYAGKKCCEARRGMADLAIEQLVARDSDSYVVVNTYYHDARLLADVWGRRMNVKAAKAYAAKILSRAVGVEPGGHLVFAELPPETIQYAREQFGQPW